MSELIELAVDLLCLLFIVAVVVIGTIVELPHFLWTGGYNADAWNREYKGRGL